MTGLYALSVISGTYELTAVPASSDYISKTVTITAVEGVPVQQNFALDPLLRLDKFIYLPLITGE
ncbi:MAG: hypothetical protein M5U34_39660 [Chloroflexi bacterium]|nr:hypothetical protein [Chloroflexota bacterium]